MTQRSHQGRFIYGDKFQLHGLMSGPHDEVTDVAVVVTQKYSETSTVIGGIFVDVQMYVHFAF